MSAYYQTTAKPRGRRDTGASETSTRSRAPSESTNLAKKISRTSDESTHVRSTSSRTNSPATYMQRHRTLDRSSLLETILPKSSSSNSLKSIEANATPESRDPHIIPFPQSHVSTPTSPILTTSELESRINSQPLNSKTSSKSMTEAAANHESRRSFGAPIPTQHSGSDTQKAPIAAQDTTLFQYLPRNQNLQPSVADESEENTPTPTPAIEHTHMPFDTTGRAEFCQQVQPSSDEPVSSKEKEVQQPFQQPNPEWYPGPGTQTWQAASPPQSPIVHQYGGFQTPGQIQYPYDYSYGYSSQVAPADYHQYPSPYYPAPFSPPAEAPQPPSVDRYILRSGSGDEQSELLNRIQSVLPDLARLLEQSREGQAPHVAAEAAIPTSQLDDDDQLASLQQELDATKKEYERVIRDLVDQNCTLKSEAEDRKRRSRSLEGDSKGSRKLKNEFEVLQAQHQDLASSVDSIRLSKEELVAEKLGVEKHLELLKKDKHILKDSHNRAIIDLKQQHLRELTSKDREHQKDAAEHKVVLGKVRLDLATLITKHTNMKKDLEAARSSETVYKTSAEARAKELDAAKLHHIQHSEMVKLDHQRTLESVRQEHKSQRQRYEDEIKKHVTELEAFRNKEREWDSQSRSLQAELQEQKLALATERDAHTSLRTMHDEWNKKTTDLAGSMELWRHKHAELQKENENVERMLQALGFGSPAGGTKPQLDQPTPDAVPAPISQEKQTVPFQTVEEMLAPRKPTEMELTRETILVAPGKELSKVTRVEAASGPGEAISPSQPARIAIAPEITTVAPTATSPTTTTTSSKREISPKESLSTRATEKSAKSSVKATHGRAQTGEAPITFRPIQYYQVPGQYQ